METRSQQARGCAFVLALPLLVLLVAFVLACAACALSWWSRVLVLGCFLLLLGLLERALATPRKIRFVSIGLLTIVGSWGLRVVLVCGSSDARVTTLPGDTGARLVDRLYPEADGSVLAAWLLGLGHAIRDPEAAGFAKILEQAYGRTVPSAGTFPTPAIATYLGLQSPRAFDTIVIQPPARALRANAAVVFLHGYAGNFYVYCWEFAQAAAEANLATLCPSLDASGAWWTKRGQQTLEATLDYAYGLGVRRVYLAGLSNGAAGASMLAPMFQHRLSGLILISGASAARPPPLPVLVVQGSLDQMMPAPNARAYAARSKNARYHELRGGHLIFLSEHTKIRPVIAEFLKALEAHAAGDAR